VYVCVYVSDELGKRTSLHLLDSREMSASRASLSILDDNESNSSDNHQHDEDDVTVDDDGDDKHARRTSRNVRPASLAVHLATPVNCVLLF